MSKDLDSVINCSPFLKLVGEFGKSGANKPLQAKAVQTALKVQEIEERFPTLEEEHAN